MFQRTLNAPRYILLHALHKILEIKALLKYEAINVRILPWDKFHAKFQPGLNSTLPMVKPLVVVSY